MCIAKVLHIGMSCPKKHICDEIIRLRLASHTIMLYVGHKIWSNKNRNEYYGFCVLRAPGQLSEADRKAVLPVYGEGSVTLKAALARERR
jgi:hypothetical protein